MADLLSDLNFFNNEVKQVQFALDGNWEQAWVLKKGDAPIKWSKIEGFLHRKFQNIACELFFEDAAGNVVFFGIRYPRNSAHLHECCQFISKLCIALVYENQEFMSLIKRISHELGNVELLSGKLSHVEVGVVDYWKSSGSIILWRHGERKEISATGIREKLECNKQLICSQQNYQAVEFAFEGEYPHWLGIQIGKRKNGVYEIDIDSLIHFANELFEFEIV